MCGGNVCWGQGRPSCGAVTGVLSGSQVSTAGMEQAGAGGVWGFCVQSEMGSESLTRTSAFSE